MWFKEVQIFQLDEHLDYAPEELTEQLERYQFKPCLSSFPESHGWASPIEKDGAPLVHAANGYMLLCMQSEEKLLPATVVRQELAEKIKKIQENDERKVYRREKQAMKDDIIATLLPRAFSKLSRIYAYYDTRNNYLIVNTSNKSKLEKFFGLLDKTLGLMANKAFESKNLASKLTRCIIDNNFSKIFSVGESCVIQDPNKQNRVIRCQNQDLSAEAIQSFLKDGCQIHQLALHWHDRMSFNLVDDFTFKSLRYSSEVLEVAKDNYAETEEQRFDADFVIMSETLKEMIAAVCELFELGKAQQHSAEPELVAA